MTTSISTVILGASGYTGSELLRLAICHPHIKLNSLTAERNAGKSVASLLPHFAGYDLPDLINLNDVEWNKVDLAFAALPHGTTQEVVSNIPSHVRVIDLSADFRLSDGDEYAKWYCQPHRALQLQETAVYGLTEHARNAIRQARLVANPGCYPTSAQLPLKPLLQGGLINKDGIIMNAVSGVSGAGRAAKVSTLFSEIAEGFQAYGIGNHRHTPEINQGLSQAAGTKISAIFTPHLAPMNRGISSTIHVRLNAESTVSKLREYLQKFYANEPFVIVEDGESIPSTRQVRGTNRCVMSVFESGAEGSAVIISVIDNLLKGASGQAVQNMNVMFGIAETTGLMGSALWP